MQRHERATGARTLGSKRACRSSSRQASFLVVLEPLGVVRLVADVRGNLIDKQAIVLDMDRVLEDIGLGGIAGSLLFSARGGRTSGRRWIAAGSFGTLALATAWIPGSLAPMVCGVFAFATLNAAARLSMTGALQDHTPLVAAGGVTAVARGASNAVSVALKFLLGAAFALGAAPRSAFAAVGAGLTVIAALQFVFASRLSRDRG